MVSVDLPARDGESWQFPTGRPGDVSAAAVGGGMASRAASGALVVDRDRAVGPLGVREGLSRLGLGVLSPEHAGLLVYGYATGVFSSRKLERATYDSGFPLHRGQRSSRHDTIAAFRRRFLDRIEGLFVEVLLLAREAGVLKLRHGGAPVHANASRHSALRPRSPVEGRGGGVDGVGGGGRWGGCARRDVGAEELARRRGSSPASPRPRR